MHNSLIGMNQGPSHVASYTRHSISLQRLSSSKRSWQSVPRLGPLLLHSFTITRRRYLQLMWSYEMQLLSRLLITSVCYVPSYERWLLSIFCIQMQSWQQISWLMGDMDLKQRNCRNNISCVSIANTAMPGQAIVHLCQRKISQSVLNVGTKLGTRLTTHVGSMHLPLSLATLVMVIIL